ncbi:hypothetical protein COCVIDRAFT_19536 [Bipolaris victoriae FI3]|uniref:Uncharacterized protein n=1 Tax=Bipolaris victoriae (strain FI3) TaxID=930091 RepID=W7EF95_BIPV3|nr:hypothetical protein COCVIDRAFT_19536 [Bipolaris victoriae FI3]
MPFVCMYSCVCVCVPACLPVSSYYHHHKTCATVSRAHRFVSRTLLGPACIEKKQSDASGEVIRMKILPLSGTLKPHPRTCRDVWIVARPLPAHDASPHHTQRPSKLHMASCHVPLLDFARQKIKRAPPFSCHGAADPITARPGHGLVIIDVLHFIDPHPFAWLSYGQIRMPLVRFRPPLRPITIATTESQSRWANHSVRLIRMPAFCFRFFSTSRDNNNNTLQTSRPLQYTPFRKDAHPPPMPRTRHRPSKDCILAVTLITWRRRCSQ